MGDIFQMILKMSRSASVMICVILLVRHYVKRKLPSFAMPVLWSLALLLFGLPIFLQSQMSVYNLVSEPVIQHAITSKLGIAQGDYLLQTIPKITSEWLFSSILPYLWACGGLIVLVGFILLNSKLHKRFRDGLLLSDNRVTAQTKSFKRLIRVYTTTRISTPTTYGLFSPKVMLPQEFVDANDKGFEYVIRHELQHIRNFDALTNFLWLFILALHWFNPLAWIGWFFMRKDMEIHCDAQVIKGVGVEHKADYAQTLLDMTPQRHMPPLSLAFKTSLTGARIYNIMTWKRTTPLAFCGVIALTILLFMTLGTGGMPQLPPMKMNTALPAVAAPADCDYIYYELVWADVSVGNESNSAVINWKEFKRKSDFTAFIAQEYGKEIAAVMPHELAFHNSGFGYNNNGKIGSCSINAASLAVQTEQGDRYFEVLDKSTIKGTVTSEQVKLFLTSSNIGTNSRESAVFLN